MHARTVIIVMMPPGSLPPKPGGETSQGWLKRKIVQMQHKKELFIKIRLRKRTGTIPIYKYSVYDYK